MCRHVKRHQPPEATPGAAPGYMRTAQALRHSGAAVVHADKRTRRRRARGPARRAAITTDRQQ
jgi:hypothetical protein